MVSAGSRELDVPVFAQDLMFKSSLTIKHEDPYPHKEDKGLRGRGERTRTSDFLLPKQAL